MSDRSILREHGTKLFDLKPSMIVHGAQYDLRLKKLKHEYLPVEPTLVPIETAPQPIIQRMQMYLFHRKHVMKAKDAAQLIGLAIDDREIGRHSAKYHTRLIYEDDALLRVALAMACSEPTATEQQMFEIYKLLCDGCDQ